MFCEWKGILGSCDLVNPSDNEMVSKSLLALETIKLNRFQAVIHRSCHTSRSPGLVKFRPISDIQDRTTMIWRVGRHVAVLEPLKAHELAGKDTDNIQLTLLPETRSPCICLWILLLDILMRAQSTETRRLSLSSRVRFNPLPATTCPR